MTSSPRRRATQLRILDAAAALFAEHGVEAVSMDQIAGRAALARGTLYYNFATKEDIVLGIAVRDFSVIHAAMNARIEAGEPAERLLSDLFTEGARWFMQNPHLARIVSAAPFRVAQVSTDIPQDRPSFRGLTRAILLQGQAQQVFRADIDVATLAQIVSGLFNQAVLVGLSREAELADWLENLLTVLLDGMRRRPQ